MQPVFSKINDRLFSLHSAKNVNFVWGILNLAKVGCDADISEEFLPLPSRLVGEGKGNVWSGRIVSACE